MARRMDEPVARRMDEPVARRMDEPVARRMVQAALAGPASPAGSLPSASPPESPGLVPARQRGGMPAPQGPPVSEMVSGLVAGRVAFSTVDGPGKRFVLRLQGCQFDCLTCHRPSELPISPQGMARRSVDAVAAEIAEAAPYLTGVTISGGEPTLQPLFVHALLSRLASERATRRLTRMVETNGDADPEVWQLLAPVADGFMVDLKALDDRTHVMLTGHSNARVRGAITALAELGLLYEVRLLPIPGINDSDAELAAMAAWLLSVDPRIRVRVNEFHRLGTRPVARELAPPRRVELVRYRRVLSEAGINDLVVP